MLRFLATIKVITTKQRNKFKNNNRAGGDEVGVGGGGGDGGAGRQRRVRRREFPQVRANSRNL